MQSHSSSSFKRQVCYFIRHSRQNHGALVHSSFVIPTAISSFFQVEGGSHIGKLGLSVPRPRPVFLSAVGGTGSVAATQSKDPYSHRETGQIPREFSYSLGSAARRTVAEEPALDTYSESPWLSFTGH